MLISSNVWASNLQPENDELTELLKACDKGLVTCQRNVAARDEIIRAQSDYLQQKQARIDELEANERSFFKQPVVLIGIGVVTTLGVLLTGNIALLFIK
jgi:hypothetical protein